MPWILKFVLIFWLFGCGILGQRILPPQKELEPAETKKVALHLLHDVIDEAFSDVLGFNLNADDRFNEGITESDQKVLLFAENISGENVTKFCSSLAVKDWANSPEVLRTGVLFKPVKEIPIPVVNLTIQLPNRWFREPCNKPPTVYICYTGYHFIKLDVMKPDLSEWAQGENYRVSTFKNDRNERCRVEEILVVMDDEWTTPCPMPNEEKPAKALFVSKSVTPRVTYDKPCDERLGVEQPCCLFKFQFNDTTGTREFHRCFGSVSVESLRSDQIPKPLADLLLQGGMTRRFVAPQNRICREIEFKPMEVLGQDGQILKMNRLDAVKCAAYF